LASKEKLLLSFRNPQNFWNGAGYILDILETIRYNIISKEGIKGKETYFPFLPFLRRNEIQFFEIAEYRF